MASSDKPEVLRTHPFEPALTIHRGEVVPVDACGRVEREPGDDIGHFCMAPASHPVHGAPTEAEAG